MREIKRLLGRYGVVLSTTVLAFVATLYLDALHGRFPFALFIAAVIISGFHGGMKRAVVATLFSVLFLVLLHGNDPDVGEHDFYPRLGMFVLSGVLTGYLSRVCRRAIQAVTWVHGTLSILGDAVLLTDARGRITFLNPAAYSLTRWTRKGALHKPAREVFQLVHEDTRRPMDDPVGQILRTGIISERAGHALLVTQTTPSIPIDYQAAPLRDAQGNLTGVLLAFRDVTERRRADRESRQRDEGYRLLEQTAKELEQRLVAERNQAGEKLRQTRAELVNEREKQTAELARVNGDLRSQLEQQKQLWQKRQENFERMEKDLRQEHERIQAELRGRVTLLQAELQKTATDKDHVEELRVQLAKTQAAYEDSVRLRQRAAFLIEASRSLHASLDGNGLIQIFAKAGVPRLGDCCFVYALETNGGVRPLALANAGIEKIYQAWQIGRGAAKDKLLAEEIKQVLQNGKAGLSPQFAEGDSDSWMCLPLMVRGNIEAAVVFLNMEVGRRHDQEDLELAEEFLGMAAQALANARLHQETDHRLRCLLAERDFSLPKDPIPPGAAKEPEPTEPALTKGHPDWLAFN